MGEQVKYELRDAAMEIRDAMAEILASPQGVVPKEAEQFYDEKMGIFLTNKVLAVLSKASPVLGDWKPIATAPTSNQTILVCLPRINNLIIRAAYSTVHRYWRTDLETEGGINRPTFFHEGDLWMHMPNPPSHTTQDDGSDQEGKRDG